MLHPPRLVRGSIRLVESHQNGQMAASSGPTGLLLCGVAPHSPLQGLKIFRIRRLIQKLSGTTSGAAL